MVTVAVDEEGAIEMLNANCFVGRNGAKPRYIIIHGTAGGSSAENIASYFKGTEGTNNPVSAHYVVGRDGVIVQCNREADGAWANGVITPGADGWWLHAPQIDGVPNPNLNTISIEHVKPSDDNSDALTAPQQASSFALIKHICQRNGIPARMADATGGITGHFSIDPVNRSRCPGNYPWDALRAYLSKEVPNMLELSDAFAQAYFKDDGARGWLCPRTGHHIGGAILDYYRSIQGAPRLPLTDEVKDVPGCAYQIFEAGMIIFDPNHVVDAPAGLGRCYMVKLSDSLPQKYLVQPVKDQLNNALAQIKVLQQQLLAAQNSAPQLNDLKTRINQIHTISDLSGEFLK